jgi:hypothetical protein
MVVDDAHVLDEVLSMMNQLAGDWEYGGTITPNTCLLADLRLESLDLVVIGTSIQKRYGRLPFSEFLAEIGQRPVADRDVSIGELVAVVCRHRTRAPSGEA